MAESDLYQPIKERLETLLLATCKHASLEVTAATGLSEKLKAKIPQGSEIVFTFLKKRPDLFGFVDRQYTTDLITVEVKEGALRLEDIYQAKLYKEVFGGRYGFLITNAPIPEELKRLCRNIQDVLRSVGDGVHRFLVIGQFDPSQRRSVEWFEGNPFDKEYYWK